MLGPLEVISDGGHPLPIGGARPRALLALLLLADGRAVPVERLADELWPEDAPRSAVATIHSYISRLRRVLPDGALVSVPGGYALRPGPGEVDRVRFESALADSRTALRAGRPEDAAGRLTEALALWRGSPLPELADTRGGSAEIARLEEMRRDAEEDRFDAELAAGRHVEVLPELERAVVDQPLRERRWGQLMVALYRAGRQTDALRRYQDLRRLLAEELGLDPGPELSRLEQAILVQDRSLDAPGPRSPRPRRRALPSPITTFVARTTEVVELAAATQANRLVTVVGPGGVGKTRVALEVARGRAAEDADDEVVLVELAAIADPALVRTSVAAALRADESENSLAEAIAGALGGRRALVMLDNCEHLVDACASVVDELLLAVPGLHVLATSREPLGVPGEAVWRLRELGTADAVELFRARAGQAAPGDDPRLVEVCERLDGLPLAIELAAARLRTMGLDELRSGLDDRFRLLGAGPRTGPARHRTLRALVQWSHDLLDDDEQRLFAMLSVFAGSFDAEAVATVAAALPAVGPVDAVVALADLADKSLLDLGPGNRYRMLETIRELAAARLDELGLVAEAKTAHLAYYAELARRARAQLQTAAQPEWLERCERDHANIRAACDWGLLSDALVPAVLDIGVNLFRYWFVRGHLAEGRRLIEAALDSSVATDATIARAWGHLRAGGLADEQGDLPAARVHLDAAMAAALRLGDRDVEALAGKELGYTARAAGDIGAATELGQQAVAVARDGGSRATLATCLANLGAARLAGGHHAEARSLFEEALELLEDEADVFGLGVVLGNVAVASFQEGDVEACLEYVGRANELHRRVGNLHGLATTRTMEAQVALIEGDLATAEAAAVEALDLMRDHGRAVHLSIGIGTLAEVRLALEVDVDDLLSEKLHLDRSIGFTAGEATAMVLVARQNLMRGALDDAATHADRAVSLARGSGYEVVLGTALTVSGLIAARRGHTHEAVARYEEAITLLQSVDAKRELGQAVEELAQLRIDRAANSPDG